MILTDKPYIETPHDDTPLMHYLNIQQLLYILNYKSIIFSSVPLYKDKYEACLSFPSYMNVIDHSLLEDNTPVKKDNFYLQRQQENRNLEPLLNLLGYFDKNRRWCPPTGLKELEDAIEIHDRKIDTFAWLIHSFSRHFMFAHCWSMSDAESILMWDRYDRLGSKLAIKTTIGRMKKAFAAQVPQNTPIIPHDLPMYIGKIQYKDYNTEHITGFENYHEKNLSDPNIIEELFYQPVFHKQKVYQDEKEVRIIISFEHFLKRHGHGDSCLSNIPYYDEHWGFQLNPDPYSDDGHYALNFSDTKRTSGIGRTFGQYVDINELIENIIISPYAEPFMCEVLQHTMYKYGLRWDKAVNSSIEIR